MEFMKKMFIKAKIGWCGCSSFKSRDQIESKPKLCSSSLDHHPHPNSSRPIDPSSSSSSSYDKGKSTSSSVHSSPNCSKLRDSVAIVKESNDPFLDFRQSMLEMINQKEIYTKEELQELLDSYLQLNSASHHQVIVRAFMAILERRNLR